ncbi:MAG TPA: hypothetical protein DCW90_07550 [Lachnospiraceae bacterium]|nr:hypothetical protein [Lachnospiraceae bacterium]
MKNREKYAEEIRNYNGDDFCKDFIKPIILKKNCCNGVRCPYCKILQTLWLDEEYKEPEVDWSKVPVDTLIRVKENEIDEWVLRYFAKYRDGRIYAWDYGCTSKTTDCVAIWRYAEIVNEEQ